MFKPPVLVARLYEMSVMNNSVDDCGGKLVVGEHRPPFTEREVRRNYERLTFIRVRNHIEQHLAALKVERKIPELVKAEQVRGLERFVHMFERAAVSRISEHHDERGEREESHPEVFAARLRADRGHGMGFPAAASAEEHERLLLPYEIQREHLLLREHVRELDSRKVIAVERLEDGKAGILYQSGPACHRPQLLLVIEQGAHRHELCDRRALKIACDCRRGEEHPAHLP